MTDDPAAPEDPNRDIDDALAAMAFVSETVLPALKAMTPRTSQRTMTLLADLFSHQRTAVRFPQEEDDE